MSDFDVVSKPSHYASGGIECKDAMKAMMEGVSVSPYVAGWWMQAVQYLWRWPNKNGIQDLKKAREVIGFMIDFLEYDKDGSYDTDDFDTEPPIVSSETELVLTDRGGRPWTKKEERTVSQMNKEGYTDKEISEVIGRSVQAIQCHRSISKSKKSASNARKRWTKDEEVRLVELYTDDFNKNQIAKKLGRSKDAIKHKLYLLENEGDF